MTLQESINAGQRAAKLLIDTTFIDAVERTKARLYAEWCSSENVTHREEIHAAVSGCQEFVRTLQIIVGDGEVAEHDLREIEREQDQDKS